MMKDKQPMEKETHALAPTSSGLETDEFPARMWRGWFLPLLAALTFIIAGLLLLLLPTATNAAPPAQTPDTSPSVAGGQSLWLENCQPCHGPAGQGDGPTAEAIPEPLPDLSDPQVGRQTLPVDNFDVIKNGRMDKMMPPWGNRLSDAQIWDAAAYVWSLSTTPQTVAAGEAIFAEQCAACHGESGAGDGPEAPANIVDFTDLQVMVERSQADLQANFLAGEQHAPFKNLPEAELWQALDYVRTFSFDLAVPKSDGVITGQVVNATTGEPVAGLDLTLHGFQNNAEIANLTTQSDETGTFTFENVPTEHTILYMVEGEYQDVVYVSDEPGIFTPDSTETTVDLKVYEPTTEAGNINITQLHYLLSFTPDAVNAVQIFVVGNNSDRTYIGQDGQTFPFSIPEGATGLRFENDPAGVRFVETADGYADTEPIGPGPEGQSIVAVYDIPYNDDSLTIDLPLPADTAALNVLMSNQGANLSSDQLQFVENRQVQGSEFSIFNGGSLAQGDTLSLRLSGLDDLEFDTAPTMPGAMAAAPPVNQQLILYFTLGLGGLAIVGVGLAYPLMRPKLTHRADLYDADPELHRQKLLLMLARLDEAYEAGELDESVYRQARARYKAELVEVMEES